jgi:hypothetical protein
MAKLTPQDRENYQKLYNAADNLSKLIPDSNNSLKELTSVFVNNLSETKALSSFDQLLSQVELTGSYLTIYQLFADTIKNNDAINKASLDLRTSYNQIKVSLNQTKASLEAVDDDFLDDLTTPCHDSLFLEFLPDTKVKTWTKKLLNDQALALENEQVENLINAWGNAVTTFVEDARKKNEAKSRLDPTRTETIAHFFCIHNQLEELYSELFTVVALNS